MQLRGPVSGEVGSGVPTDGADRACSTWVGIKFLCQARARESRYSIRLS